MHLKQITIKNFRCFEGLQISLHPRLTVLVAENGGGKTAILDAIALGLSLILDQFSTPAVELRSQYIHETDLRKRGASENLPGKFVRMEISLETEKGILQVDGDHSTGSRRHLNLKDEPFLPAFAYYGARRGWLPEPEKLIRPEVRYHHPTSALLGCLQGLNDFGEMLSWFEFAEIAELRTNRSRDFTDQIQFPALSAVRKTIVSLLGNRYSNPRFDETGKFVVQDQNQSGELQVTQLSQGYQSMLALGMDFARRLTLGNPQLENLDPSSPVAQPLVQYSARWNEGEADLPPFGPLWSPAIMLVDEIDLHLHPSWQQRVLRDLMRAFPCTQFIVATHSPQIISTVPKESILIIKDGQLRSAPAGTDGAETQRILEDVFQVPGRPETEMSKALYEYLRLVDERKWDSDRAKELRTKLDAWSQGREPRLLEADLQIDNMKWEMSEKV